MAAIAILSGLGGPARAQAPAPAPDPDSSLSTKDQSPAADPAKGEILPLSYLYKFIEQYNDVLDPNRPDLLTQYEVGSRETFKFVREVPQGAPERGETSLQTVYTERVAKLSPTKTPLEVVRRYDKSRFATTIPMRIFQKPALLEALTIRYLLPPSKPVQIFNLSAADGRRLRQREFDEITKNPFLPKLASYLPTTPRRVGDVWRVPPSMTALLLSEPLANDPDYDVEAELVEVRGPSVGSKDWTAVLGLKGQVVAGEGAAMGPVAFNIRVHFTFKPFVPAPPPEAAGSPAPKRPEGIIEARGYISQIRMAETRTFSQGDGEERLKKTVTRELVLARRILSVDRGGLPLAAPETVEDEPETTWITYDDPLGDFHVDHPQSLRLENAEPNGGVVFLEQRPNSQDLVVMQLVPKTGDAAKDRQASDAMELKKNFMDHWTQQGDDVLLGSSDWLKEPEWDQLKRKVYRIEAAIKSRDVQAGGKDQRVYIDYYIVKLPRDETLMVEATTDQTPHLAFRARVETMIKRFNMGPSEGQAPAPTAASPAPARTPPPGAAAPPP